LATLIIVFIYSSAQIEQNGIDSSLLLPHLKKKFGLDYFAASDMDDDVDDALVSHAHQLCLAT
jgi:hypothetical protein